MASRALVALGALAVVVVAQPTCPDLGAVVPVAARGAGYLNITGHPRWAVGSDVLITNSSVDVRAVDGTIDRFCVSSVTEQAADTWQFFIDDVASGTRIVCVGVHITAEGVMRIAYDDKTACPTSYNHDIVGWTPNEFQPQTACPFKFDALAPLEGYGYLNNTRPLYGIVEEGYWVGLFGYPGWSITNCAKAVTSVNGSAPAAVQI